MPDKSKGTNEEWSAYAETVLHFQGETTVMVDLREVVAPAVRRGLGAMGLGGGFAVLTAHNPRGVGTGEDENLRMQQELEAELESAGASFVRVDACSPDKSHCECSVALLKPLEEALDVARRWEQVAIFWWDGATFWIYSAISQHEPVRLPV